MIIISIIISPDEKLYIVKQELKKRVEAEKNFHCTLYNAVILILQLCLHMKEDEENISSNLFKGIMLLTCKEMIQRILG